MNSIYIIGEESFDDAIEHGEKILKEVDEVFASLDWKKEKYKNNILVESKEVSGQLEKSKILIMRSKGKINKSAKEVFDLLVSPEGYAILDPVCDPSDHKKPLIEEYTWKEGSRLELATANMDFPLMPKAEFLVLNVIDADTLTFGSKSVVHPKYSGSSIYYEGDEEFAINSSSTVRAINTMAIRLNHISQTECELLVFNYIDMCIKKGQSPWLYNMINRNFFNSLYKRIEKYKYPVEKNN